MTGVLGLVGGLGWETTGLYHRVLNVRFGERRGGFHSAPTMLDAPDSARLVAAIADGDHASLQAILLASAQRLLDAGVTQLALCGGAPHLVAPAIAAASAAAGAGFLDIREAVADRLAARDLRRVLLLDAQWHADADVWRDWLTSRGVEVLRPASNHRAEVHRILIEEFGRGRGTSASRQYLLALVEGEVARHGLEAVLIGGTELGACLTGAGARVPVVDAALVHAGALADRLVALEPAIP